MLVEGQIPAAGAAMCDKCTELDSKIAHYQAMLSRITDKITLDAIAELIAELLAKKAELHPETEE
ncbi:hypothetical protein ACVMAJ_006877 [Bradyrhizobium sp. USDA 4448]